MSYALCLTELYSSKGSSMTYHRWWGCVTEIRVGQKIWSGHWQSESSCLHSRPITLALQQDEKDLNFVWQCFSAAFCTASNLYKCTAVALIKITLPDLTKDLQATIRPLYPRYSWTRKNSQSLMTMSSHLIDHIAPGKFMTKMNTRIFQ